MLVGRRSTAVKSNMSALLVKAKYINNTFGYKGTRCVHGNTVHIGVNNVYRLHTFLASSTPAADSPSGLKLATAFSSFRSRKLQPVMTGFNWLLVEPRF